MFGQKVFDMLLSHVINNCGSFACQKGISNGTVFNKFLNGKLNFVFAWIWCLSYLSAQKHPKEEKYHIIFFSKILYWRVMYLS